MPRGVYERYTTCQQCGHRYYIGNTRVCPQCGAARELSKHTRGAVPRFKRGDTRRCDKCGTVFTASGFGKHYVHCDGQPPRRPPVTARTMSEGNEIGPENYVVDEHGFEVKPKRTYNKSGWTVSLVNGDRQIAAKVSNEVAKRIIGLLL